MWVSCAPPPNTTRPTLGSMPPFCRVARSAGVIPSGWNRRRLYLALPPVSKVEVGQVRAHQPLTLQWNVAMKIALGQINTTVGDFAGNVDRMVAASRRASALGADLIAFPELSITGYPPRDLVEKESFVERSECELMRLARETANLT